MIFYFLDASAWVKRYFKEKGTDFVQNLFALGITTWDKNLDDSYYPQDKPTGQVKNSR